MILISRLNYSLISWSQYQIKTTLIIMKKTILMLFAVAIASVNLLAQEQQESNAPKKSPEERADNMTKRMTKELGLNPDQQTKMKALILSREQEREQKSKGAKPDKEKREAEMKAILTPEQFQKLQQIREEEKDKRHERRPSGSNGTPPPPSAPPQK